MPKRLQNNHHHQLLKHKMTLSWNFGTKFNNLNVGACPNFSCSSALASTLASASASALLFPLEVFKWK